MGLAAYGCATKKKKGEEKGRGKGGIHYIGVKKRRWRNARIRLGSNKSNKRKNKGGVKSV